MTNHWVVAGCASAFTGVAMGAFGAHALAHTLPPESIAIWNTAAQYQMFHSLALILFGIWMSLHRISTGQMPGYAFLTGIVLFSGSLYVLALTGIREFGAITPFGGVSLLFAWALFGLAAFRYRKAPHEPR